MIHIHRVNENFKENYEKQNLRNQTLSCLEVNGKILSGISEYKVRQTASASGNCILQNPHWLRDYVLRKWYPLQSARWVTEE